MTRETLNRYLLHQLSEKEREDLERDYFAGEEVFEQLQAAEADLIDAYVQQELPHPDRSRFEEIYFASEEGQQSVAFARALQSWVVSRPPREAVLASKPLTMRSIWLSAALFAVCLLSVWLWVRNEYLQNQLTQTMAANQSLRNSVPAPPKPLSVSHPPVVPTEKVSEPVKVVAEVLQYPTFSLKADLQRDADESRTITVRKGNELIQLQLQMSGVESPLYRVSLQTVDGEEIWGQSGLHAETGDAGKLVTVRLPVKQFPAGDYIVALSAVREQIFENVQEYYFRLSWK